MENKLTHDTIVGSGLASNFINLMKLEGWLPIEDYFAMRNNGIELDWVTVLTMENDGFIAIPTVAEYCIPHPDSGLKPGWYNSEEKCLDDWTNAIMFKPIETKNVADRIRDELLDFDFSTIDIVVGIRAVEGFLHLATFFLRDRLSVRILVPCIVQINL